MLKKLLLILFVATAFLSSCKKDTGTNVTITPADLASVNAQLKGSWVFPVKTLTVLDDNGKAMFPPQNLAASAFYFDGFMHVDIMPDPQTVLHGTYVLSTKSTGGIYIHIDYPDGSNTDYQVVMLNGSTLTLSASQPDVYYHNGTLEPTEAVTSTSLQRIGSGTVLNGNLVKITVKNDSVFSVKVYLTRKADGKTILMDSINNTSKAYSSIFTAKTEDHLKVNVIGKFLNTSINAYADGLPIEGDVTNLSSYETVTTDGWNVSFPQ
ncbi:hypothetical protein ACPPVU_09250 [Mucilaginibacter sp. McL0603]|uniref:hypothetical protein n=1 Tax=Mucilaginibacter sp. McL0603 TaxID=3415670 RepID=UPI003CF249AC